MKRSNGMATHRGGSRQRGAILVVGLIVLLLMTLLGLSIMGGNAVEEKMAGNERDRQIAFQAAEAALREGERLIVQTNAWQTRVNDSCTNGFCKAKKLDANYAASIGASSCSASNLEERWVDIPGCTGSRNVWSTANRHRSYTTSAFSEVNAQAMYIIELVGNSIEPPNDITTCPNVMTSDICPDVFRVTAVGIGGTSATRVVLQSTYKKPL